VLDFASVVGVDATATRSCFLMIVQLMRSAHVTVVFTNMSASLETLFRVHKVSPNADYRTIWSAARFVLVYCGGASGGCVE
jgi:hypothetical protein